MEVRCTRSVTRRGGGRATAIHTTVQELSAACLGIGYFDLALYRLDITFAQAWSSIDQTTAAEIVYRVSCIVYRVSRIISQLLLLLLLSCLLFPPLLSCRGEVLTAMCVWASTTPRYRLNNEKMTFSAGTR